MHLLAISGACPTETAEAIANHLASVTARFAATDRLKETVHYNELFAGVLAHDLRNPIGVARFAIQRLVREESIERRQASRKTIELILRALDRLGRLVEDLLMVGQVEGGRVAVDRAALEPEEIISDVADSFAVTASAASLRIDIDLATPLPPVAVAVFPPVLPSSTCLALPQATVAGASTSKPIKAWFCQELDWESWNIIGS